MYNKLKNLKTQFTYKSSDNKIVVVWSVKRSKDEKNIK